MWTLLHRRMVVAIAAVLLAAARGAAGTPAIAGSIASNMSAGPNGAKSVLAYIPPFLYAGMLAGTNTTDLTNYVNTALNDATNTYLRFPDNYLFKVCNLAISARPPLTIYAFGAHIQNSAGCASSTLTVNAGADHVSIYGGNWQGSGPQSSYAAPVPNAQAIHFAGANYGDVEWVYAHEGFTAGISFEGSSYNIAKHNRVSRVYFGPGIGESYSNNNDVEDNYTDQTAAEGITSDNTSYGNIVEHNHISNFGRQLSGQTLPRGVTVGCFGGIGAGSSSNYSSFSYNIITTGTCLGIGFQGAGNRIVGNIMRGTATGGIAETYYFGAKSDGRCCITSDQGNNTIEGNYSDSTKPLFFDHDTGANTIGINNFPNGPIVDDTNGNQGNAFLNESGLVLVNSTATAALTYKAFGKVVETQGAIDWGPTLPPPAQQAGATIDFWCNSVAQTIHDPGNGAVFGGPYGNAATKTCGANAVLKFRSDGFSWIILQSSGG